jgi:hypothetical protein
MEPSSLLFGSDCLLSLAEKLALLYGPANLELRGRRFLHGRESCESNIFEL